MKFSQKLVLFAALFAAVLLAASGQTHAALVVAFGGASAAVTWSQYQAETFAFNGFFGRVFSGPLLDEEGGRGGGGGTHAKVLEAVTELKKSNEDIVKQFDQWQPEHKKLMEEFTQMKNQFASFDKIQVQLTKLQGAIGRERQLNYGNSIDNLARDPDKAAAIVALFAEQMGPQAREFVLKRHPGAAAYAKQLEKRDNAFGGMQFKGITEGTTPGSAFIDTNEVERDIYDLLTQYGAYTTVDYRTIGAKATEIPIQTARPEFQFVDEAGQATPDTNKAGSRIILTPKKAMCLLTVSREVLEDDIVGLVRSLMKDFVQAGAKRADYITFAANADSAGNDGGFTGMFNAGTSVVAASTHVSIATLTVDDFIKTVANAPAEVIQSGMAKWWLYPNFLIKLLYIKDSYGRPIFQTLMEVPNAGQIGAVLGYPVVTVGNAPSTDSTSSKIAAFGDPDAMAVRIRRSFDLAQSEHFAFDSDQWAYRATVRMGAKIKIATGIQVLTTAAS